MVPHALLATATVIGFFVMAAWILMLVWLISKIVGEFHFSRMLKKRSERDFDVVHSTQQSETYASQYEPTDGSNDFDTAVLPIRFNFYDNEDDLLTEETAAVFNIQERYYRERS